MPRARVIAGAAVLVYVNGKPFGRVSDFSFSSMTPLKAIYGIDSTDPYELATTTAKISGSMKVYRTVGDGGAEGAGMTASFEELSRQKYFSLMLVERGSDTVLFQAEHCSLSRQSWGIPTKGHVSGSLEFEALTWSNDVRPLGVQFG